MAYKQKLSGGSNSKTAPFKQTMGAAGAGAGTATGKYITKKVKQAGKAVSSANEAGKKSYDESIKGDTFWGGSGAKRSYSKNPTEYVKGFVKDITSDKNAKTNQKKKSPVKQMETIKKIGSKIYEGGKYLSDLAEGKKGTKNYSGGDETMRLKNIAKKNPKTGEVKKVVKKTPPAKQLGKQAVTKVGGKKAPTKMKKC